MDDVERALLIYPELQELDYNAQLKFINKEVNPDFIIQELEWYYNEPFASQLTQIEIQNKIRHNDIEFKKTEEIQFKFNSISFT